MTNLNSAKKQSWTTDQLISLSSTLANVYGAVTQVEKGDRQDEWTTEKLIKLSQTLSEAYSGI